MVLVLETEDDGEVMNSILQPEHLDSLRKGAGNRNSIPLIHRGLAGVADQVWYI